MSKYTILKFYVDDVTTNNIVCSKVPTTCTC